MKNGRRVSILVARSTKAKPLTWQVDPLQREWRRVTLLVVLNEDNTSIREMRLFQGMLRNRRFTVREHNMWLTSGLRLNDVREFGIVIARVGARRLG